MKAVRGKETVTYEGVPIRLSADFLKEILQARRDWKEIFKVMESEDLQPRLPSKSTIGNRRADKVLPRQGKAKGAHHHQAIIIKNAKGTYFRGRRRRSKS